MNRIDHNETPRASVEFYPSLDDFVHISLRIGEKANHSALSTRAYQFFLVTNAIGFPAFLMFREHFIVGLLVFALNLVLLIFIIPRVNSDSATKYYRNLIGDRENRIARVDLSDGGIRYSSDEGYSFWPWTKISSIEETETSIYFYFDGNGVGIQKSGFPYMDEQVSFIDFARSQVSTRPELRQ